MTEGLAVRSEHFAKALCNYVEGGVLVGGSARVASLGLLAVRGQGYSLDISTQDLVSSVFLRADSIHGDLVTHSSWVLRYSCSSVLVIITSPLRRRRRRGAVRLVLAEADS